MFRFFVTLIFALDAFAAPAVAQERQWVLDAAGEDVFLAFGVPGTNDVGISFWCKIGHKDVSLFSPQTNAENHLKLRLTIGPHTFPLVPKLNDNEGSKTIEARLQPQRKILDALEAAERFEVSMGKHTVTYPLAGADIQGMLKLCAGEKVAPEN